LKILTFSSLYPHSRKPSNGIFVENRLRQLLDYSDAVEARVVAPVPWFPSRHPMFGSYATFAGVAPFERRRDIDVWHPKYAVIPKVGMQVAPWLMYRAARRPLRRLRADGFDFDLIDAHYFYPDGVAAMMLAAEFDRPFVVTARGTDINLIPDYPGPRKRILAAIRQASHLVSVSAALQRRLCELGAPQEKTTVLRNGVDLAFFRMPADRPALRQRLGFGPAPVLLSVGNLVELKGHHLVIEAMHALTDMQLVVIGDGEQSAELRRMAEDPGLAGRVRFAGRLAPAELVEYYQAADMLVLASSREGWANVLLEAMACGTPAVATPVGGTPEVVGAPAAGQLTADRSAQAIVAAVRGLTQRLPDRSKTRAYAEGFSWDETSQGQIEIFARAIAEYARSG
jgi:glycosyltransferase involved in cell wall biosynthesis